MAENPAISVIVPMYKVEPYIKLCVDSILNQTFRDFEIILVDDASPDGCFELCQKLYGGNDKVKFIRHEKNCGLGITRNTGMKHARGKYIYFVDSDDFILPQALEKFYNAAEKNNAQVVHSAGWYTLNQDEPEPVLQENLKQEWDGYNQEGFLTNNLLYRLENHWKTYRTWPMAWLHFCRRDFLEENHLEFWDIISEDEPFCFELFCLTERYYILHEALYVYRRRSGSIMKSTSLDKFEKAIRSLVVGSRRFEKLLDRISRFENYDAWRESITNVFFSRIYKHTLLFYNAPNIGAVRNAVIEETLTPVFGDNEPFVRYFFNGFHLYRRQAEILSHNNKQVSAQMMSIFNRMEISDRKIVFVNFLGRGYGCNPKYIAEEILRQNLPFDLVWLVRNLDEPMPEKIRKVLYGSLDSIYELATAKVIVTNVKNLLPYPNKKQGQYLIMTWHGGPGFKLVEQEAEEKLSPVYVEQSKLNSKMTDLMITDCQEQFDEFRRAFWYKGEILKCGIPRNDIFFNRSEELVAKIRETLNVPADSQIIMYAPTFRDNPKILADVYKFDIEKLFKVLKKKFGGKWTLLMRFHPNVAATAFAKESFNGSENVINVTDYPDMQELILVSDALISDYSGVIYDFMISDKPVFIFAKDFDAYTNERGFKQLYFDLPYPVNKSEAKLFTCIKTFDKTKLEPAIKKFLDKIKPFDTGHASETIVERIKTIIGSQLPALYNITPPREVMGVADDWRVFTYVRDKYAAFLNDLPIYKSSGETSKTFWWCWLQGLENAPPISKMCLKSLRRNYSDYQINVVTLQNISNYVSFPEHIIKKFKAGKISPTHFSDLLRLELLINYGGIWLDSCVLCTGRERDYLREPLFIFQSTWRNNPAHLGSNWFIVSEKENPILKTTRDLLYKYWEDHDTLGTGGFYFVFHCMFKLAASKYPDEWAKVPLYSNIPPHVLQMEFFKPYNPDRFEQIKRISNFHKLTWKYPPAQLTPEKTAGSNYDYLMKFFF